VNPTRERRSAARHWLDDTGLVWDDGSSVEAAVRHPHRVAQDDWPSVLELLPPLLRKQVARELEREAT
jgi:hypothetical protein